MTSGTPARRCYWPRGLNPKLVQEFLGHSEIGTTLNVYSHVLPEQRGETAARMDTLLGAG